MAKLDDFLTKKKENAPILDLSRTVATTNEEFRRMLEKVPDFKMKAEKVPTDTIKIRDKKFKFKSGKKDLKAMRESYTFMDPLPAEMNKLKISELASVSIDWKMLTTLKPKSKIEENYFSREIYCEHQLENLKQYMRRGVCKMIQLGTDFLVDPFSRLVELGKLEIKTRAYEKRQMAIDPQIRKTKNKAGIVEMRVVSCAECGEDFCNGKTCCAFGYDASARVPELPKANTKVLSPGSEEKGKRKVKRKTRSKSKSKKSGGKTKSPKRSPSKNKKSAKSG